MRFRMKKEITMCLQRKMQDVMRQSNVNSNCAVLPAKSICCIWKRAHRSDLMPLVAACIRGPLSSESSSFSFFLLAPS